MKDILERIWRDSECRMPLNRTRWTTEETTGSTQEDLGLYYSRGNRVDPRKGKTNGKKRQQ